MPSNKEIIRQFRLNHITDYSAKTVISTALPDNDGPNPYPFGKSNILLERAAVSRLQAHDAFLHERLEHFRPEDRPHILQNQFHQLAIDLHRFLCRTKDHLVCNTSA